MASHGVLDACTNGGLGIAFFAPFSNARYFFPGRPLEVSPLSVSRFLTADGLAIFANEMQWVWAPAAAIVGSVLAYRYWRRTRHGPSGAA
jgi:inner membrane protein